MVLSSNASTNSYEKNQNESTNQVNELEEEDWGGPMY